MDIVYKGKAKNGEEYVIRYPQKSDVHAMLEYINALSREKTYTFFQGEQLSLQEEDAYVNYQLQRIAKQQSIYLLAFTHDVLIAAAALEMQDKGLNHTDVFSISVAKNFRGLGIGKKLTEVIFKEAQKHIQNLKIIILHAYADNHLAIDMYKEFGFKEYARLPKGARYRDEFVDYVSMYKKVQ